MPIDLRPADKQSLRTAAKNNPTRKCTTFVEFLTECLRWRVPINVVLDTLEPNKPLAKKIRDDCNAADYRVRMPSPATFIEIPAADLDKAMPEAWGAPEVEETPAVLDENGNVTTPAVTRPRKWREARMYFERNGKHYCPASDGVDYFDSAKLNQLALTEVAPEDIPAAVEPPE